MTMMLFQTPGGNMEVWQVLKTKNTQVYFNGETTKAWTITWSMDPMISSQHAELNCHYTMKITFNTNKPKIGVSTAKQKLSISLTSCFLGSESPFTGHSPTINGPSTCTGGLHGWHEVLMTLATLGIYGGSHLFMATWQMIPLKKM